MYKSPRVSQITMREDRDEHQDFSRDEKTKQTLKGFPPLINRVTYLSSALVQRQNG